MSGLLKLLRILAPYLSAVFVGLYGSLEVAVGYGIATVLAGGYLVRKYRNDSTGLSAAWGLYTTVTLILLVGFYAIKHFRI